jgi:hypothetical protein
MRGKTFGRLTVHGRAENYKKNGEARWACYCEGCGALSIVLGSNLRRGPTKGCKSCNGGRRAKGMGEKGTAKKGMTEVRAVRNGSFV